MNSASCSLCRPPRCPTSKAVGSGSPVVQRLGWRSSSSGGAEAPWAEQGSMRLGPGVGVLVSGMDCPMPGVGAELPAAGLLVAAAGNSPVSARPGSSRGASPQRRDTPLPHIAARHQQAEAAARREVDQALAKRGSSLVALVRGA